MALAHSHNSLPAALHREDVRALVEHLHLVSVCRPLGIATTPSSGCSLLGISTTSKLWLNLLARLSLQPSQGGRLAADGLNLLPLNILARRIHHSLLANTAAQF